MTNVSEWSVTAGLNNSSPPNGWPEGMARSAVNDCAREMQAALARWYQDSGATEVTAGTGNAYTLATNSAHAALSDIPLLVFRTDRANTGAATLNVDGLGDKPLRRSGSLDDYASGEITSGQTMVVAYNSGTDDFEAIGPAAGQFAAGTLMLFQQTAAPTGWTKQATHDDKSLRVVSGTAASGGGTAFTSVFGSSKTTGSHTLSTGEIPSHTHPPLSGAAFANFATGAVVATGVNFTVPQTGDATTGASGGGGGHTHTLSLDLQYVDAIIAAKA